MRNAEDASQHMLFTFAPEKYWEEKYREESKARQFDADIHRNHLWQLTCLAIVLISFAFTLGLSL